MTARIGWALCLLFLGACSSSRVDRTGPLDQAERDKLDPQLHFLFDKPAAGPADPALDIVQREDGALSIGVRVEGSDLSKLPQLGIVIQTADSDGIICRVDPTALRRILQEPSVRKIIALKNRLPAR